MVPAASAVASSPSVCRASVPRLGRLHVDVGAAVVALGAAVKQVAQGQQRGGLARLPRSMEDEVPLPPDESENLGEVQPFERRNAVVLVGPYRPGGVEVAHDPKLNAPGAGSNHADPPEPRTRPC